ncbi:MAG: phosphocholine cytidylyltransferase family protein [Acidimicrobiia bacterium]|nr:phosphocholine cytidylyltransferase family protein [Acidimicrobiia bacterium]
MIGIVLAAGAGTRLLPLTESLPKTLLAVDGERTILDVAVSNLAVAGVAEIVIVTGFAAAEIESRVGVLAERHGVAVTTLHNERWDLNNSYSLWLAGSYLERGAVVVNGDTLHPVSVVQRLLERAATGPSFDIALAVDDRKVLGAEAMKVVVGSDGTVTRISKEIDPRAAAGEYIGVACVQAASALDLVDALAATWTRDPSLYYEDGFQALADAGGRIEPVSIGAVEWVEVDDPADLARARSIGCLC